MGYTADQPPRHKRLLLERETEMAALEALLAELSAPAQGAAASGTGGLLVFAGPAGLGKTTLLGEVRRRAVARGCTVLSARGGEQEQGVAFQVVRHLVQPLLATGTEQEHREALGSWYDIVAPAVGLVAGASGGSPDPQGVRDGLDWIVTRFAMQRAPLVVVLDDAHWADAESLAWLTGFAPRVTELPMLLVVAYRPDELPRDALAFGRLAERHGSRTLDLAPLTPGAVSRIVRDTLGEDADEAFCRETWAVTGGNPFEAVELAARVADRGLKPQAVHLPELRELASAVKGGGLIERLERLGTSAVRFAWSVAVLGADASRSRAAGVGGLGEAESAEAVAALREARILAEPPRGGLEAADSRLEFFHPLVSTAVYRAIPAAFRVAMHGQAAAVVTQSGLGVTAAARHLLETHPESDPWVVQQLSEAAREYLRAGAPDAARRCLARALREPPAMEDRAQVLFELGCSALLTEPAITVNHLRAALDEPVLAPELRDAIVYRLAQALGHSDRMAEAARTVAEAARRATDLRTRLHLQAEQFMWDAFRADEQDSTARSRKLARLADHLTARGTAERYILGLRAWDAMVRGEPAATALHFAEEALGGGLPWTDDQWGFEVPVLVALTFLYCDQPGRAEDLFHQGIVECQDKGWRGAHLSFGHTLLGYIRFRRGRLDSAETMVREGLRIADRVGHQVPAQYFAVGILIEILLARGRTEEARMLAVSYHYGDIVPSAVVYPDAQTVHSELLLALGRDREAERQLTAVGERLDARGMRNPAWCPWPLHLAAARAATDPDGAVQAAEEGVRRARRFGTQSAVGQALHALAAVTPLPGRAGVLAEAVAHLERSPSGYDLARALVDHGVTLRRTGLPQQAAEQLHRGLESAVQCGADALAARAREELNATGLWPLQPRTADADSLTVQERAVAEWAAGGWSNARIAEALGASDAVVRRLLSDIYLKAGCDHAGLPRLVAESPGASG
ncbi:ATP-binding protein [Actinacidiphila bryophytorum]|uniref:AAA ATPase domain-containing protein n=1 Tax=Actinacidiphila bryophytorum TaxID=1436133 RepID=A0A9W4MGM1_9ACTN|nr:AAA family ATPase [Actinacidiphila bryophytorum]MBN6543467.1 AAA family ATPase [Actinacidiphila bryophytorum]CAG7657080.1 AAA ATPase domain-containing protein [Actinacidiphila bryophytorum]